jgi:hypothetical protein
MLGELMRSPVAGDEDAAIPVDGGCQYLRGLLDQWKLFV